MGEYSKPCSRDACEQLIVKRWRYLLDARKYCSHKCAKLDRRGYHHSEETLQRMRRPHKRKMPNYVVWNKGLTKEDSRSIRQGAENARKTKATRNYSSWAAGLTRATDSRIDAIARRKEGKPCSEETKRKISAKLTGREGTPCSEERKRQISASNSGRVRTPEMRLQNSLRHRGKVQSEETKRKKSQQRLGCKASEATKQKASISRLKYLEEHKPSFKWFNTKPEQSVKGILEGLGVTYVFQKRVGNRLFDFYLPDFNLLVEVDGVFHHGKHKPKSGKYYEVQLKIRRRDRQKNRLALKEGYALKRVWSDEIEEFAAWIGQKLST